MLLTLDLPTELEQQLQTQADLEQLPLSKFVEKIIAQSFPLELTMQEIEQKYVNEWVLVAETDWNEHEDPIKGMVLAHSPDRHVISEALRPFREQNPHAITYIFYTGDLVPEGMVFVL